MPDIKKFAHLVGSIPLNSSEEVFCSVCDSIGSHIKRLPDGETGERTKWIFYQRQMLTAHPAMEPDESIPKFEFKQWDGKVIREVQLLKLKNDVDLDTLIFPIGYSEHAIESFKDFTRLQSEGKIPADVKFQVSLPTPFATGYNYVSPNGRDQFLEIYEKSFGIDVAKIMAAIPHDKLAVQWDVCQEVLIFENYYPDRSENYKQEVYDQLARIGDFIPADVELGYHICYGSPGDDHVVKPRDFAISVEISNGIIENVNRSVEFIHMPGTYGEPEDAFYAPLSNLNLPEDCELYLGLLFYNDQAGDAARISAARKVVPEFGISTVCGWGRADPDRVPSLLESHKVTFG
tara:strand:- start:33 stop:1073 length:1041 start_codon:yes stop_codon:yes gene_type:complete